MKVRVWWGWLAMAGLVLTGSGEAWAINALQLYAEGSTYQGASATDPVGSESWVTSGAAIRLWTIADVGKYGNIDGVKLSVAYDQSMLLAGYTAPTIEFTPTKVGGTGSYAAPGGGATITDPSLPDSNASKSGIQPPTMTKQSTVALDTPKLGDGSDLPDHGVFNQATTRFQEFSLGNFRKTDSNIGDFAVNFPTSTPDKGQINAYDVKVTGLKDDAWVHFDLYDHYVANCGVKYVKAPFSHDVTGGGGGGGPPAGVVPEPGTLMLLGTGLMGLCGAVRRTRAVRTPRRG